MDDDKRQDWSFRRAFDEALKELQETASQEYKSLKKKTHIADELISKAASKRNCEASAKRARRKKI